MIRTANRLRLCVALLTVNLIFIWGNSLLPGSVSGAISQWLRDLIALLFPGGLDEPDAGHGLLRKLAHFTEFCTLGMCLRWLFGMLCTRRVKYLLLSFVAGAAAACIDETIQCFVPGRGPGLKDVGIDTLGVVLGIVLISLTDHIRKHKSKHLEENKQ